MTAYNKRQKAGNHNALSGKPPLGARGPVCGSERYTSTLAEFVAIFVFG